MYLILIICYSVLGKPLILKWSNWTKVVLHNKWNQENIKIRDKWCFETCMWLYLSCSFSLQPQEPPSSLKSMAERVAHGSGLEEELSALHITSGKYHHTFTFVIFPSFYLLETGCPSVHMVVLIGPTSLYAIPFPSLQIYFPTPRLRRALLQLLSHLYQRWTSHHRWGCVRLAQPPFPKSSCTSKPCRSLPGRTCHAHLIRRGSGAHTHTHACLNVWGISWMRNSSGLAQFILCICSVGFI